MPNPIQPAEWVAFLAVGFLSGLTTVTRFPEQKEPTLDRHFRHHFAWNYVGKRKFQGRKFVGLPWFSYLFAVLIVVPVAIARTNVASVQTGFQSSTTNEALMLIACAAALGTGLSDIVVTAIWCRKELGESRKLLPTKATLDQVSVVGGVLLIVTLGGYLFLTGLWN